MQTLPQHAVGREWPACRDGMEVMEPGAVKHAREVDVGSGLGMAEGKRARELFSACQWIAGRLMMRSQAILGMAGSISCTAPSLVRRWKLRVCSTRYA